MSDKEFDKLSLPYDPDLKEAVLKITAILDEYKIGGSVLLASKTHAEFKYHFPKWSIVQWDKTTPEGQMVRIKSKKDDFESLDEQHEVTQSSVHLIAQNRDMSAYSFGVYDDLYKKLEEHMDIDHNPGKGFTPHQIH